MAIEKLLSKPEKAPGKKEEAMGDKEV